jgi:hypothetical protein
MSYTAMNLKYQVKKYSGVSTHESEAIQPVRKETKRGTRFHLLDTLPARPAKLLISIHYWTEYRKGLHLICQKEATQSDTVSDIIKYAIDCFERMKKERGFDMDSNPQHYVMRLASKTGQPKTDLPILHSDQNIVGMKFQRFTLCNIEDDLRLKDALEENLVDKIDRSQINERESMIGKVFYYVTCQCFIPSSE